MGYQALTETLISGCLKQFVVGFKVLSARNFVSIYSAFQQGLYP